MFCNKKLITYFYNNMNDLKFSLTEKRFQEVKNKLNEKIE